MATEILQLTLALIPAVAVGLAFNKVTLPWEKQKRYSERAELLGLLAKDVKQVKFIMAKKLEAVNACPPERRADRACALAPLPLANWKNVKNDNRLRKYASEPIFKTIINQFREWERI